MQPLTLRSLLAVHAHPDDECVTTGGVLARYSAEGVRTVVVTCTGGEVGEISDPGLASPANLGEVRARELAEALRILGVCRSVQLGYRDSGMAGTPDNQHPACFHQADLEEAAGRLVRIIREERPQVLVTYDENGGYGHPDHIQAHRVAVAAFRAAGDPARFPEAGAPWAPARLYYAVFPHSLIHRFGEAFREAGIEAPFSAPTGADAGENPPPFGTPDDLVTAKVDVAAFVEAKRDAMLAHRTQFGPEHFFARLPWETARPIWAHEFFQRGVPPQALPPGPRETDLFGGLPG